MRCALSILTLLALSLNARAQQTVTVTPQTLNGWTVTGTDLQSLAKQHDLSLPAGAQLARAFNSPDISLKVVTSPAIGPDAADWPVLEIGRCFGTRVCALGIHRQIDACRGGQRSGGPALQL